MTAPLPERALRQGLLATVKRLDALGLNRGSTGNASVRPRFCFTQYQKLILLNKRMERSAFLFPIRNEFV